MLRHPGTEVDVATNDGRQMSSWADAEFPADRRRSTTLAENFGEHLRRELRARNWTIRYFALRSGVDHSTISRLMKGQREPTLATAIRLDAALHGPSPSADPGIPGRGASFDPLDRIGAALSEDPVLDRRSVDEVLRYYQHVRSRSSGPRPR